MMRNRVVAGRAPVALVTALSLALSPAAPLVAAPTQAAGTPGGPAGPPASLAPAKAPPRRQDRARGRRPRHDRADGARGRRLAARLRHTERRARPRLPAAGRELGQPDAHGRLRRGVVRGRRARRSPRSAPSSSRPTRRSPSRSGSSTSRPLQITESNFPTLPKEQVREVVAEIDKSIPDDERVIALDRVLANLDKSQIIPKNVEGVKADPPTIFFSADAGASSSTSTASRSGARSRTTTSSSRSTRTGICSSTRRRKTLYLRNDDAWLKATDARGPVDAGRASCRRASRKLPGRRQLEGREGRAARQEARRRQGRPEGLRQHDAGRADPAEGRPALQPGHRHRSLLWVSNTESDVFRMGEKGAGLLPRLRPLVHGARLQRPVDVRDARRLPADFKKIPLEHPRSRVLAVGARHRSRRPRRCCSRRFRRRRASTRRS